jgi:hypothetical protein
MGISNSQPVQLRSGETPADVAVPVDLIAALPGERIPVVGTLTVGEQPNRQVHVQQR